MGKKRNPTVILIDGFLHCGQVSVLYAISIAYYAANFKPFIRFSFLIFHFVFFVGFTLFSHNIQIIIKRILGYPQQGADSLTGIGDDKYILRLQLRNKLDLFFLTQGLGRLSKFPGSSFNQGIQQVVDILGEKFLGISRFIFAWLGMIA